jgi:hypothetical protein
VVRTWFKGVLLGSCLALTGCLLSEAANVAPGISIQPSQGPYHRGESLTFTARAVNDGSERLELRWGHLRGECPADLEVQSRKDEGDGEDKFVLEPGPDELGPICVWAQATDQQGAYAVTSASVVVEDRQATIEITQIAPLPGKAVPLGTQVILRSSQTDLDGDDLPELTVVLLSPSGIETPFGVCDEAVSRDANNWCFVPTIAGTWKATAKRAVSTAASTLTAPDPVQKNLSIIADNDQPPCLIVTPVAASLVQDSSKPLRLEVSVRDDLDSSPAAGSKAAYHWSVSETATGPFLADIDSKDRFKVVAANRYRAGDELSVRIDVSDRIERASSCQGSDDVCGNSACIQRMTWKVMFR